MRALWYTLLVLLLCGKLTDTLVMRGNGFFLFILHILLLIFFLLDANQLVLLAFWCVVLLGLPFWWKTTEVYRAHLPIAEVESWQTREVTDHTRKRRGCYTRIQMLMLSCVPFTSRHLLLLYQQRYLLLCRLGSSLMMTKHTRINRWHLQ